VTPARGVLSADVGGTAVGIGVVTPDGEVRLGEEHPVGLRGPGTVLETLLERLAQVRARAEDAGLALIGCGIGVPGPVDVAQGRLGAEVHNLPELAGCALRDVVAARTGLPTVVDNDVNALALGEARFGVAQGLASFVVLALGTGVGGGVYLGGQLWRGASGYGGELGHVTVSFDGRPCFCGSRGCLKAYVAGPDIAAQAREAAARHPESALARRAGELGEALSARHVFEAARAGDSLGRAVVERVCQALGAALGGIMNGLNPQAIVLSGGVAASLEPYLGEVRRWARAYAMGGAFDAASVQLVPHTKTTALRGAGALFLYEEHRTGPPRPPPMPPPGGLQRPGTRAGGAQRLRAGGRPERTV
jgi:predicted NBD/HSP70 family sugar kinase